MCFEFESGMDIILKVNRFRKVLVLGRRKNKSDFCGVIIVDQIGIRNFIDLVEVDDDIKDSVIRCFFNSRL